MQKRIMAPISPAEPANARWVDLIENADVQVTSEDAAHPVEAAFRQNSPFGWQAAQPGPQTIWLTFRAPRAVREIHLRFEAAERRTQEFVLRWSDNAGGSFREIVRQRYNFSEATRREEETYFPNLSAVTDLRLEIVPDVGGGNACASVRAFFVA